MVIAVEEGIKRVVNNKKLYHRLLKTFSGRKMADQIIEAAQKNEFKEAADRCHALKGTAGNLAMRPLAEVTTQIEERLLAGESADDLFPVLMENIDAVEVAIQEILAAD